MLTKEETWKKLVGMGLVRGGMPDNTAWLLYGKDLRKADLSEVDLSEVDLSGANLSTALI